MSLDVFKVMCPLFLFRNVNTSAMDKLKGFTVEELTDKFNSDTPLIEEPPNNVGLKECSVEPNSFPPYDVMDLNEHETILIMAIPGYSRQEVSVELEESSLMVTAEAVQRLVSYSHKGIPGHAFAKVFEVNEGTRLVSTRINDGFLFVRLDIK
jgi:HSP20 family molecular chaperone IbpA